MTAARKIQVARAMMVATIVLIIGFQLYWITKLYKDEWKGLERETDVIFRETVYKLQVANFKNDTTFFKGDDNLFNIEAINVIKRKAGATGKPGDSSKPRIIIQMAEKPIERHFTVTHRQTDSLLNEGVQVRLPFREGIPNQQMRFVYHSTSSDSTARPIADSVMKIVKQRLEMMRVNRDSGAQVIMMRPSEMRSQRIDTTVSTQPRKRQRVSFPIPVSTVSNKPREEPQLAPKVRVPGPTRIFTTTALTDTISLKQLDSAYHKELAKAAIKLPFEVKTYRGVTKAEIKVDSSVLATTPVPVGLVRPVFFQAAFSSVSPFLFGKIAPQMILSVLLVGFTIASFIVLYRNVLAQQRLAEMKNEFISNITHELKTPIATVNVAIEAMKSFNALHNPERTKEYLDISSSELQRLSLLVDKVLKLSMFEKKEIELKKEPFDMQDLVKEVMGSMRLQFEKCKGSIKLYTIGSSFYLSADRLHITSVIYNLLDNAIKYCKQDLQVDVTIEDTTDFVRVSVKDNGVGIAPEFKEKVFEKFFRVPMHNTHNIKGYGLGLSYVAHIVQQHGGTISVQSTEGEGSNFIVELPKK